MRGRIVLVQEPNLSSRGDVDHLIAQSMACIIVEDDGCAKGLEWHVDEASKKPRWGQQHSARTSTYCGAIGVVLVRAHMANTLRL